MARHRRHDYDDGFDEVALHEEENLDFAAIRIKRRPRIHAAARKSHRTNEHDDVRHRQRIARVKAWGVPY